MSAPFMPPLVRVPSAARAVLFIVLLGTPTAAGAADLELQAGASVAPAEPPAQEQWALSTGLLFVTPGIGLAGLAGGVGGLYGLSPVRPGISAERRLSDPLWLLARLSGSYAQSHHDGDASEAWSVDVAAGVRWVLTSPDAPVDVSTTALIGVGHSASRSPMATDGTRARSTAVTGSLGLTVARELVGGLSLAASVTALSASWATSSADLYDAELEPYSATSESFALSIPVTPRLELRYEF